MDAGTLLRTRFKTGEAMAWLAVSAIRARRGAAPRYRHAFVLRSLKHPAELERLRAGSCPKSCGKGKGAFFRVNSSQERPAPTGRGGMRHAEVYSQEG